MDVIKVDDFPLSPMQDQIYEIIPDKTKVVASTNRLFNKYPTRYISAVPRFAINAYTLEGDSVLDPFCGSGTTAIEAILLNRNAYSIDIDPFARLLIKVKTTVYKKKDLDFLDDTIEKIKGSKPQNIKKYSMPDIPNIEKWFNENSVLGLAFFKERIDTLTADNEKIHDYLYVVLAGIIRKVSNSDEVSPKPYISTRYPKTPADPFELFYKVEGLYREAIIEFSKATAKHKCKSVVLKSDDARTTNEIHNLDLSVTSPPYINAYDYVRSLKFENLWLGLASDQSLRDSRKSHIGTEIAASFYDTKRYASQSELLSPILKSIEDVDKKRSEMVATYFEDMSLNMMSVRDSLKSGGHYVIVVGDSTIRGQSIPTARILSEIAVQNGYTFELSFKYVIRDRYLHLPRAGRGGIINYDEVLVLRKN